MYETGGCACIQSLLRSDLCEQRVAAPLSVPDLGDMFLLPGRQDQATLKVRWMLGSTDEKPSEIVLKDFERHKLGSDRPLSAWEEFAQARAPWLHPVLPRLTAQCCSPSGP